MQGKGIVRFFLITMIIVSALQYLFIVPTQRIENKAENYAQSIAAEASPDQQHIMEKQAYANYLDSISNETAFSIPLLKKYTYQELKAQQLALGLDLKGGMSVVMQVNLEEFLTNLTSNPDDETFKKAIAVAKENQANDQSDFISLFADAWRQVGGDIPMRDLFRRNDALRDVVNTTTSNGEMTRILREKGNETVQLTYELLKQRIDKLGVTQPNISLDAARDLIVVELPGIDNPERARQFLSAAAKLEFWNVYRITDNNLIGILNQVNERLKTTEGTTEIEKEILSVNTIYAKDSLGNNTEEVLSLDTIYADNGIVQSGPLFDRLTPNNGIYGHAVVGLAPGNEREQILSYLERDDIAAMFPRDIKWAWSRAPESQRDDLGEVIEDNELFQLFAIKKDRGSNIAPLTGEHVISATANPDPTSGQMEVSLRMDQSGARTWGRMTTQAAQDNNRPIAILLDDEVVSAPNVNQPITGGSSSITGNFSIQEANDLAQFLEVGKLPATTEIIQESIVGPSLGAANIKSSIWSLVGGFLTVLLFMVLYYGSAGFVSIISLLLNLFFIFGALSSLNTVLTLPGIAGIVLTIGMAVDANVIIFERIREELRDGKNLKAAIADGFNASYSAIIDANVTTFITAAILAYFGLGPIKGFAVVLMIGVVSSVFTAVLVGRLMIEYWLGRGKTLTFWTNASKNMFANMNVDWLAKRKMAYIISGVIISAGLISMATKGFDLGVDFKGGYSYNVEFKQDVSADQVRQALAEPLGGEPTVKAVNTKNTFNIVTDFNIKSTDKDASSRTMMALYEGVKTLDTNVSLEQFRNADSDGLTHVNSSSKVGPTIADDIQRTAVYATIFALLFIFLYLFLRFNRWQYSAGAVAALFHDTLLVLGVFSLFHGILPFTMEIDQAFIAAILTVIGYSINDTVVVFDRIREFLNLYTGEPKETIINRAVNSTVSRTVITSVTTMFVVFVLFVFGGGSIKGFAFALLIGIIVGTYSSIFIATPIMSDLSGELKGKQGKRKRSSFSKATAGV